MENGAKLSHSHWIHVMRTLHIFFASSDLIRDEYCSRRKSQYRTKKRQTHVAHVQLTSSQRELIFETSTHITDFHVVFFFLSARGDTILD